MLKILLYLISNKKNIFMKRQYKIENTLTNIVQTLTQVNQLSKLRQKKEQY